MFTNHITDTLVAYVEGKDETEIIRASKLLQVMGGKFGRNWKDYLENMVLSHQKI